jgi:hypothetical protein
VLALHRKKTWVQALPWFLNCSLGLPASGTDLKSGKGLYSSSFPILKTFQRSKFYNFLRKLFRIKFTLFCNRRDVIYIWSLTCPLIKCTLIAHGRICVHKRLDFLTLFYFGRFYLAHFKLKRVSLNICRGQSEKLPGPFKPPKLKMISEGTHAFWKLN